MNIYSMLLIKELQSRNIIVKFIGPFYALGFEDTMEDDTMDDDVSVPMSNLELSWYV